MAEPIKLPLDDQEKLLLHLANKTEAIEQALIGIYSIFGEDATYREQLTKFLKERIEEHKDETPQSLTLRTKRIQGGLETPMVALFDILQKALHSPIILPDCGP